MYYDIVFMLCYLGVFSLALYNKEGRLLSFLFLLAIVIHFLFAEFLLEPLGSTYPVYYYVSISLINMMLFLNVLVLERRISYRVPILLMIIIPYIRAIDIHINYFGYTFTYYLYTYAVPILNGWLIYNLLGNDNNDKPRGHFKWFSYFSRTSNSSSDTYSLDGIFGRYKG